MDRLALGVGEDLHLNVPRAADGLLDEGSWVTEGALSFTHCSRNGVSELLSVLDPTHATAAATGNGLDKDREPNGFSSKHELIEIC
jgi:hypothetical protein